MGITEGKSSGENNKICRQVGIFFIYLLDRDIFEFQSCHSCNHNNNRSGGRLQRVLFGPVLSETQGAVGDDSGHWIRATGRVLM